MKHILNTLRNSILSSTEFASLFTDVLAFVFERKDLKPFEGFSNLGQIYEPLIHLVRCVKLSKQHMNPFQVRLTA